MQPAQQPWPPGPPTGSAPQPAPGSQGGPRRAGRGFVVSGIVVMAVSVLVVVVTVAVFAGRIDLDGFTRDVAIAGNAEAEVGGQVGFRVIESLSSSKDTMTVGVGVSSASTSIECEILNVRGEQLEVRRGSSGDTFSNPEIDQTWTVAVVAEDLEPGEYTARCDSTGEPSVASAVMFTPGRVVTVSEVFDFAGPAFAVLGGIVLGGFLAVVGLILLVIGLVRSSKARKEGQGPLPPGPVGPPPWPGR